jgi:lysophospholipase L1-like esterase
MALTAKKVYAILKRQISDMEVKLNSPVRYRGTVATADLLPLNPDIGDMYNIESKSIYGEAGMNVAWNGVVWDTMGAPIDMSLYLTKEEAEAVIQRLVTEYFEKNPVKPGATTEQAQQIEQNKTDIASLKEDLDELIEKGNQSNLLNPIKFVDLKSWDSKGNLVDNSSACAYSEKIPVKQTIYICNKSLFHGCRLVNNSGKVVANLNPSSLSNGVLEVDIASYPTAMYVLLNYSHVEYAKKENLYFGEKADYEKYGIVKYDDSLSLSDKFNGTIGEEKLNNDLKEKVNNPQIEPQKSYSIEPYETQENCFMNYNGNVTTSSFWNGYNIAKFKLNCGEKLIVHSYSTQGDSSNVSMCERFSDGSPMKILYNAEDYTTNPMIHVATKRQEYIWVGYKVSIGIKAIITLDFETIMKNPIVEVMNNWDSLLRYRYKKSICIGDSLTVGKQPSDTSRDNYPEFLSRMTGMEITNAGQSGATTRVWVTNWLSKYNFADYDCAFICLGTNGDLVEGDDNYNAYLEIIEKIQTDNPLCMIFILEALNTNAKATLKKISASKNLPFLEIFTNEFYYLSGINGQAVSATHDMKGDPTHLSPVGYLLLARNVVTEMTKDMVINPQRYNQRFSVS